MANVYAEHLSSLGKEAEIMFLENEAEDRKLYALLSLRDAALEASYLEAEAVVLRENGSADDLLFYYKEAEEEAAKDNPGIVRKLINLIRNQITKFLDWLRKVIGKNDERLNTVKGTEQTVSKSHFKIIGTILNAWDTIHNKINDWYNQLSTRKQEILSLGSVTFMTFGLKELGKEALDKLRNDKSTEKVPGDAVAAQTKKAQKVDGTLHKLMGKFEDLINTINTSGKNSYEDAKQAAINRKQRNANAEAGKAEGEPVQDSVNPSGNSLFGDLMLEKENQVKNKEDEGKSDGNSLPPVKDENTGTPTSTTTNAKSQNSGDNKNGDGQPAGTSGSGSGKQKSIAQKVKDQGENAKSRQVQPVAPENGAQQVTQDDLKYGDKAVIVIETILRFIKSLIDILNGSIVELIQQLSGAISAMFKGKGASGEETDESASDNLFGMALDDDVPVTESVMDELAEILNYI